MPSLIPEYSDMPSGTHETSLHKQTGALLPPAPLPLPLPKPNHSENYLETILILSKKLPVVRSVDIANELGYKKSSVSIAMKNLREKNNITVSDAGFITLTESGRQIAEMIYERHELLSECLEKLGVDKEIAAEDACRIEHVISPESFEAIKKHIHKS